MFLKKRKIALLLAGVLSASMIFSACTIGSGGKGKTAVIDIQSEPKDLCTITVTDAVSMDVIRHLVDGLTILDENDKAIPGVAKDWTVSPDGLVYTFNLRDDYVWSNGEKVTAHDFEFAFKSLVDPNFLSDYGYIGYIIKNAEAFANGEASRDEVGAKAIDDTTFELTLEYPASYVPELMAFASFSPINQKGYEAIGEGYGTDTDKIVTNGAFKLEKWEHESEIVLTKNNDFPDAKDIKLDSIVMKMISDSNTRMNSFKSNELDLFTLTGEQLAQMKSEGVTTYNYNDGAVSYFEFNLTDPMLKNVKIRKAIAYAIDSENFVKNVVANNSVATTTFTPPGIAGSKGDFIDEVGKLREFHMVDEAKKLLAEGMKEEGLDKISITFITEDSDTGSKYSAFLQENLQNDLGIEVKVEKMPFKSRLTKLSSKDFQVSLSLWAPDYNDPMTYLDMFESTSGNNHGGYSNPEYDTLLKKVRNEPDRETRFGYLIEIEKLLAEDVPVAPYYFRYKDYVVSDRLQGVIKTAFQQNNLRYASIK